MARFRSPIFRSMSIPSRERVSIQLTFLHFSGSICKEVEIREACFELQTVHSTPFNELKRVECTVWSSKQAFRISVNNGYFSGSQLSGPVEPPWGHARKTWFHACNKSDSPGILPAPCPLNAGEEPCA